MRIRNLSSAFAVILPVCLGLGVVYLTIGGHIEPAAAVMTALGVAAVIGAALLLRDFAASQELDARRGRR